MKTPYVQNASNRGQVDAAKKREKDQVDQAKRDLYAVLDTPEGRRTVWRWLTHCGVYRSIFEPNSRIAYNAGMQDVGHFIQGEIIDAHPQALFQMMKEEQENENG